MSQPEKARACIVMMRSGDDPPRQANRGDALQRKGLLDVAVNAQPGWSPGNVYVSAWRCYECTRTSLMITCALPGVLWMKKSSALGLGGSTTLRRGYVALEMLLMPSNCCPLGVLVVAQSTTACV